MSQADTLTDHAGDSIRTNAFAFARCPDRSARGRRLIGSSVPANDAASRADEPAPQARRPRRRLRRRGSPGGLCPAGAWSRWSLRAPWAGRTGRTGSWPARSQTRSRQRRPQRFADRSTESRQLGEPDRATDWAPPGSVVLSIEPAGGAPGADSEAPVIFPGYVCPTTASRTQRMREVDEALARAYAQRDQGDPPQGVPPAPHWPARRPPDRSPTRSAAEPLEPVGRVAMAGARADSRARVGRHGSNGWLSSCSRRGSEQNLKVILFTSCHRAEGRTTLVLTLARALSRQPLRTLVVDADLTGPMVAQAPGPAAAKWASTTWSSMARPLPTP